ncbi:MAG: hypothetical protein US86_C0001G0283 [Candidatus Daviesbacteria bacterium GW2011_GWA2_38_24]|uniref:Uncharacterized protein n=1 Tax=Candidatus Daviesbacteria bacterium GW2011_GWA2_38_24 TaxID=1618422 RepID=A0A0G0MR04_9BACT|nr:MAG: hypothetical protein US86_C0001G0283 [Candidatus Daviesbacteria bacterium GW2011_GWA2_38_24]KKQ78643.1 MAG: hypothetical protein UT01_C0064G0015 [Candidatus Daviesbacteria bacterium GW2011_GWA1_38_7]
MGKFAKAGNFLIILGIIITIFGNFFRVNAGEGSEVCFCHNVDNNPHTVCTSDEGEINGHMSHVRLGLDTEGPCPDPSSSPSPTPASSLSSPTPAPSIVSNLSISPSPSSNSTPSPNSSPQPSVLVSPTTSEQGGVGSTNNNSQQKKGQVLGVSTLASTGVSIQIFGMIFQMFGLIILALGVFLNIQNSTKTKY